MVNEQSGEAREHLVNVLVRVADRQKRQLDLFGEVKRSELQ